MRLAFQVARATAKPDDVVVKYFLTGEHGQPFANTTVDRVAQMAAGVKDYDISVRLPHAAGRYVVSIEATDGRRSARRDLPVTVK